MSATEEVHEAETASGAVNQDQPAEATTQASEPAGAAAAEPQAALKPSSDAERKTSDSKPHSPKPKGSPAKAKASELAHSEERPSGRRERKQTAFFQPEKKTETEKLEIREVGSTSILVTNCLAALSGEKQGRPLVQPERHLQITSCCCHMQGKGTKLGEIPNGEPMFLHSGLRIRQESIPI